MDFGYCLKFFTPFSASLPEVEQAPTSNEVGAFLLVEEEDADNFHRSNPEGNP